MSSRSAAFLHNVWSDALPAHNESPRNTYQFTVGKQALGNVAYNPRNKMKILLYLLVCPRMYVVLSPASEAAPAARFLLRVLPGVHVDM